ncbi:unnamed protein product, partial [Polarella glacialis]
AGLGKLQQVLQHRCSAAIGAGTGPLLRQKLADLKERAATASGQLDDLKARACDQRQHAAGLALLQRAQADAKKAQAWLLRIKEVQAPFQAVEVLPETDADPALRAADEVAAAAEPQIRSLQALLQERLVQSRRLEGVLRTSTANEIKALQAQVDAVFLKVTELKVDTFARRTMRQMAEAVVAVQKAEAKVRRISEVSAPLSQDNLESSAAGSFREVTRQVQLIEEAGKAACQQAKDAIAKHKTDRKDQESPSFHNQLSKLGARLASAEAQLAGLGRAAREAEENRGRLQVRKGELAKLEEQVDELELLTLPLGDERPCDEAETSTFSKLWAVQQALQTWLADAEALQDNPHGALRLAMGRLLASGRLLRGRLEEVKATTGARRECALCR